MADFQNAGTALQIGDGASPEVFTTIAQVMDHGDIGVSRSRLDTTKLSSTVKTSKAGLEDSGEISASGTYDPSDTQLDAIFTKVTANNQTDTNWQLVLSTSPTETWAFSGYVAEFKIQGNTPDGLIMFSMVVAINTAFTLS